MTAAVVDVVDAWSLIMESSAAFSCDRDAPCDGEDQLCIIMNCSSPSKFRTSVNWLDRLRALKGFPVAEEFECGIEPLLTSQTIASTGPSYNNGYGGRTKSESCNSASKEEFDPGTCSRRNAGKTLTNSSNIAGQLGTGKCHDSREGRMHSRQTYPENNIKGGDERGTVTQSHRSHISKTVVPSLYLSDNISLDNENSMPHTSDVAAATFQMTCCAKSSLSKSDMDNSRGSGTWEMAEEVSEEIKVLRQHYFNMFAELFCMHENCNDDIKHALKNINGSSISLKRKCVRKQESPKLLCTNVDLEARDTGIADSDAQVLNDCNKNLTYSTLQTVITCKEHTDIPSLPSSMEGVLLQKPKNLEEVTVDSCTLKENDKVQVGISMTEVFIIDTCIPRWKAEKVIIRKGTSWKFKDRCCGIPVASLSSDDIIPKKRGRGRPPLFTRRESEQSPVDDPEKLQHSAVGREQSGNDIGNSLKVVGAWKTPPQTNARSQRKRRKSLGLNDGSIKSSQDSIILDSEQANAERNEEITKHIEALAPDHPASQPKEGLIFSIYQVFMQAGKVGLTAREAVSRILEQGLPGLHEGGVVPRVEVLKIISNSPYFMLLDESKYILCSALVGDESPSALVGDESPGQTEVSQDDHKINDNNEGIKDADKMKLYGIAQHWTAYAAIRRARTDKTRRKPSSSIQPSFNLDSADPSTSKDSEQQQVRLHNNNRLKSVVQNDTTGLGNPCNRSDGKGWHCPLRAKVGYHLCDHHLDRLRARVKPKAFPGRKRGPKKGRRKVFGDVWMVNKSQMRNSPHQASIEEGTESKSNLYPWEMYPDFP